MPLDLTLSVGLSGVPAGATSIQDPLGANVVGGPLIGPLAGLVFYYGVGVSNATFGEPILDPASGYEYLGSVFLGPCVQRVQTGINPITYVNQLYYARVSAWKRWGATVPVQTIPITWTGPSTVTYRQTRVIYTNVNIDRDPFVAFGLNGSVLTQPFVQAGPTVEVEPGAWTGSAWFGEATLTSGVTGETLLASTGSFGAGGGAGPDQTQAYYGSSGATGGGLFTRTTGVAQDADRKWELIETGLNASSYYYSSGPFFAAAWGVRDRLPPVRQRQRTDGLTGSSVVRALHRTTSRQASSRQRGYW